MHIVSLLSENVKRIRAVEIEPKTRLVQITGRNGQGKTSVLDSIYYGLVGKRALPDRPVRKGAEKARIRLNLGDVVVTRTIGASGSMSLSVEAANGTKFGSPQQVLDELLGELTFDPMEFIGMKPKNQVEVLRTLVKLDIDMDAMTKADEQDFIRRRDINREVERLRGEISGITVQASLPAARVDEQAIVEKLSEAGERNQEALKTEQAYQALQSKVADAARAKAQAEDDVKDAERHIDRLKKELATAEKALGQLQNQWSKAKTAHSNAADALEAAPRGEMVDVSVLTSRLQDAQLANREIDKRTRRLQLEKKMQAEQKEADALTRAMEDRAEQKRLAIASAAMPIPGLTFDENCVLYNGIPLDQAGEAEQIRVVVAIGMAANPKLRILRVMHGEALDADSIAQLEAMAEEHDFQIWMAKVDSSGKIGIVIEDGMIALEAESAETATAGKK